MEDNGSYLSVPLVATPKYSMGPILIAFVVIVVILGVIMYIFSNNPRYADIRPKGKTILMKIYNKTSVPYTIVIPNVKDIVIEPDKDVSLYIKSRDVISAKARTYDDEEIKYRLTVPNNIDKIYITPGGLVTSLGEMNTTDLVNDSYLNVVFIQRSNKGVRWGIANIAPNSSENGKIVGRRTTWDVALEGDEDNVISSIVIAGIPSRIVFDGTKLQAY